MATQDADGGRVKAHQQKSLVEYLQLDPRNTPTHSQGKLDYLLFTPKHFARGARVVGPPVITDPDALLGRLRVR